MSFSQFRSPHTGARYTRQLFVECQADLTADKKLIDPPYSLIRDYPDKVCFRLVYVELGDPTGYQLASRYLEDYEHWRMLMKAPWFRAAKAIWDAELDAKLQSEGMTSIRSIADGIEGVPASVTLAAAKYLANREHRKADKALASEGTGAGRPSKAAIKQAAVELATTEADVASDLERIRLVKG